MDELFPWLKEAKIHQQSNIHTALFLYTSEESQEVEITETQRALAQLGFESHWSSSELFLAGQEFGTPSSKRILSAPTYQEEHFKCQSKQSIFE